MGDESSFTESVTETILPCSGMVKVKTCGKSARLSVVTSKGDKPCRLKCHVHLDSVSSRVTRLIALDVLSGAVQRGRQIDSVGDGRAR